MPFSCTPQREKLNKRPGQIHHFSSVELVEEVLEVVAECDDRLPPHEGRRLQHGVCYHYEPHGRLPFAREPASAVDEAGGVCDGAERPHEHAEVAAQGLAWLVRQCKGMPAVSLQVTNQD